MTDTERHSEHHKQHFSAIKEINIKLGKIETEFLLQMEVCKSAMLVDIRRDMEKIKKESLENKKFKWEKLAVIIAIVMAISSVIMEIMR